MKARKKRKRDRVFSKVDGLFYVFITLSTFVSGLITTQYGFLRETHLLIPTIGTLLSLLISFVVGFKGMVNDSVEIRIWSWCLLFVSLTWYAVSPIITVVDFLVGEKITWSFLLPLIVGFIAGWFQIDFAKRFARWTEAKLTSLLGEKVSVWSKIKDRINSTILIVLGLAIVLSIILEELRKFIVSPV